MRDILTAAFPAVSENSCLEEFTRRMTYVQDTQNGRCIIVDNSQPYQFFIENIDNTKVGFLAVDKCVFDDSSEHKKCDFVFFYGNNFCFCRNKRHRKPTAATQANGEGTDGKYDC